MPTTKIEDDVIRRKVTKKGTPEAYSRNSDANGANRVQKWSFLNEILRIIGFKRP